MFHLCSEPLLLSEAGLQGLCVSLNTPVVNIEELPVGPAEAAIVLFDPGYGTLSLGVGIRSSETRRVAVFVYRGLVDETKSPTETMNAALAFAEGMGFLFDEDVVSSGSGGSARALALWNELTATADSVAPAPQPAATAPVQPPLSSPPPVAHELVLDDIAEDTSNEILLEELSQDFSGGLDGDLGELGGLDETALELDEDGAEIIEFDAEDDFIEDTPAEPVAPRPTPRPTTAPARAGASKPRAAPAERPRKPAVGKKPVASRKPASGEASRVSSAERAAARPRPKPAASGSVPLSKFRKPPAAESDTKAAASESGSSGSELGRVAIVRKQLGGDAEERPSLLMRILTSF